MTFIGNNLKKGNSTYGIHRVPVEEPTNRLAVSISVTGINQSNGNKAN